MANRISVSTLVRYIKNQLDKDTYLMNVEVSGEISNFTHNTNSNILYFKLKDNECAISCIMYPSYAIANEKEPKNGDKVILYGYVSLYENAGNLQLYVTKLEYDGLGDLFKQYEALKKKLNDEGYFDDDHKKDIPTLYPERVAVLVGDKSAAMSDINIAFNKRWPLCKVDYYPVPVQGNEAHKIIINKLLEVDKLDYDMIILSRGGGSFEDYMPFNNEELVKCIYNLNTFIITGIGHERDYTLVDFVADIRASTPTQAVEKISPVYKDVIDEINNNIKNLNNLLNNKLKEYNSNLNYYLNNRYFKNPLSIIEKPLLTFDLYFNRLQNFNKRINELDNLNNNYLNNMKKILNDKLSNLKDKIDINIKTNNIYMNHILENNKLLFKRYNTLLNAYSLDNILNRGYSLIYKKDKLIKNIKDLNIKDIINIKIKDGEIISEVKEIKHE